MIMDKVVASTSQTGSKDSYNLSKDIDTEGFDIQAGETWIYPTNYTLRDYQYNIIQEALLKNTLVSLPTGLGKTFIAAVIMYNFFRWYPKGKVIFMAPTRPLVKQQIEACYNIMAIPKETTAELTGTKAQATRSEVWKEKRVFFVTPQVLQNDLNIVGELSNNIKCVVFDEAHKAKGNHAYCEVIRRLRPSNKYFRVLALSATPGSSLNDILEVIHNLLISHLEVRTDESPDVTPYVFQRSLESVVVPLDGKLQQVRDDYLKILEKFTKILIQYKVITGNCASLTKGKIFMTMKNFQERSKQGRDRSYSDIMRNLNICVTLYHAYELLIRHGLRGFLSFFEEHAEKPLLRGNIELQSIMQDVREYLGPPPNVQQLPDGSVTEVPEATKFGHPKFYKLLDILSSHFSNADNANTRVIVFCEYRESVMEAYALLLRHRPLIRPKIFLGQGAITQKQQIGVVKLFKSGECNTMISTCIGEEGLDVGEVDLIICFDINNKSPIRMVQRMGRTGRKRQGRVVVLVTEGREQQTLQECLIHKQNLTNHILQSNSLYKEMYPENPRMVPVQIEPKCQKIFITVKLDSSLNSKKKTRTLKDFLKSVPDKKLNFNSDFDGYEMELPRNEDRIPDRQTLWNKSNPLSHKIDESKLDFSRKISKLRTLQPTEKVGHSKDTEMLVSLLQFVESKKYNIPVTQEPVQATQASKLTRHPSSDGLKQVDIRSMFGQVSSGLPVSNTVLKPINEEVEDTTELLNKMRSKVDAFLNSKITYDANCNVCENLFDCTSLKAVPTTPVAPLTPWNELDPSVFNSLTKDNLNLYLNLSHKPPKEVSRVEDDLQDFQDVFDDPFEISAFNPPDNFDEILNKCGLSSTQNFNFENINFTQLEKDVQGKERNDKDKFQETLGFFNMSCLEEMFDEADAGENCLSQETVVYSPSPGYAVKANSEKKDYAEEKKQAVNFGTFPGAQESYVNRKGSTVNKITPPLENVECQNSNTFLETYPINNKHSPIVGTYEKSQQLKRKSQKKLFPSLTQNESQSENLAQKIAYSEPEYNSDEDIFDDFSPKPNVARLGCRENHSILSEFDSNFTKGETSHLKSSEEKSLSKLELKKVFPRASVIVTSPRMIVIEKESSKACVVSTPVTSPTIPAASKFTSHPSTCLPSKPLCSSRAQNESVQSKNFVDADLKKNQKHGESSKTNQHALRDVIDLSFFELDESDFQNCTTLKTKATESIKLPLKKLPKEVDDQSLFDVFLDDMFLESAPKSSDQLQVSFTTPPGTPKKPTDPVGNVVDLTEDSPVNCNSPLTSPSLLKSQRFQSGLSQRPQTLSSKLSQIVRTDPVVTKSGPVSKLELRKEVVPMTSGQWFRKNVQTSSVKSVESLPKTCKPTSKVTPVTVDIASDSDDDFEVSGWIKPKSKYLEKSIKSKASRNTKEKKIVKKKKECDYIDMEAEESGNEGSNSDSENDETDDDRFEESFVDDDTQLMANNTMVQVKYMQSVRSPVLNRGKFKIPEQLRHNITNVYSQPEPETENAYVNDTFCVDTEDVDECSQPQEMSMLEIAEMMLEEERKSKRKTRTQVENVTRKKRRRIMQILSDESD